MTLLDFKNNRNSIAPDPSNLDRSGRRMAGAFSPAIITENTFPPDLRVKMWGRL